jgi:hypothetical protein
MSAGLLAAAETIAHRSAAGMLVIGDDLADAFPSPEHGFGGLLGNIVEETGAGAVELVQARKVAMTFPPEVRDSIAAAGASGVITRSGWLAMALAEVPRWRIITAARAGELRNRHGFVTAQSVGDWLLDGAPSEVVVLR